MKPFLKWPGGKAREISQIYGLVPDFDRYIEPFFGGGAMYFYLQPQNACINDVSTDLMDFYRLVRMQEPVLQACLLSYADSFSALLTLCRSRIHTLLELFALSEAEPDAVKDRVSALITEWLPEILAMFPMPLVRNETVFQRELEAAVRDKLRRTVANHAKKPFSREDLEENLVTGFASGYYLYFRRVYNDWHLGRGELPPAEAAANFFFVREMCYGSMFRYNAKGEFNIPYGGMSYNQKDLRSKAETIFLPETAEQFAGTQIYCQDFEEFLTSVQLTERDFLFLDPPYDTEFSDYNGTAFTKLDQARLAVFLSRTPAKFLLVIKNTPFISDLYSQGFHVLRFDKQYSYNVRSRNERKAEHLIVTNFNPFVR